MKQLGSEAFSPVTTPITNWLSELHDGRYRLETHQRVKGLIDLALSATGIEVSRTVGKRAQHSLEAGDRHLLVGLHMAGIHDAWIYPYHYLEASGRELGMVAKERLTNIPVVGFLIESVGGRGVTRPKATVQQGMAIARLMRDEDLSIGTMPQSTRRYYGIMGNYKDVVGLARLGGAKILTAATFSEKPKSLLPSNSHTHIGRALDPHDVSMDDVILRLGKDWAKAAEGYRERYT